VAEQARSAEARENRNPIASLFDDLLSGRPIGVEKVAQAINEVAWGIGGGYGANHELFEEDPYHPDTGEFQHERDNRSRPPHERVYGVPPPPPNEHLEKRIAIRNAKIVLGFAASEPVTLEQIKKRQRELARKYHPDVPGGSVDRMQQINAAVDLLERSL